MALHTALTFLVVGGGLLSLHGDRGILAGITSRDAGGVAARQLLPAAVGAPTLFGWLSIRASERGYFNASFGGEVVAVVIVVLLVLVIGWTARSLNSVDVARKATHAELQTLLLERTATLEAAEHSALHDPLTQLPNRTLLYDRVQQAIRTARRDSGPCALLLMDLNGFKQVNDTLGHGVGDQLLQHVATRVREVMRTSDTVARLGGDEFAVLLPQEDYSGAARVSEKILAALGRPLVLQQQRLALDASIGIALYPDHGDTVDALMQRADVAMYVAKRGRAGFAAYSEDRDENSRSRLSLLAELRNAVDHNQLQLHFQPKLDLVTGTVHHVEALIRWQHPQRGLIPPGEFIPLAEQAGYMRPLSCWVVRAALTQLGAWRRSGLHLNVAVNLSAIDLLDTHLVGAIAEQLAVHAISPEHLTVELTESAVMEAPASAFEILRALRELGVRVAIDDFGVGYSSLSYLARLPADELKIDRSFIDDVLHNKQSRFIVQSILDLGHNLGLHVVAEGIETQEVLDTLTTMGCDSAQGYYLGRPMAADDCTRWLAAAAADQSHRMHGPVVSIGARDVKLLTTAPAAYVLDVPKTA